MGRKQAKYRRMLASGDTGDNGQGVGQDQVLQAVEWVEDEEYWKNFCSSCQEEQSRGHEDDCKLDAAIKSALNLN